MFYMSIPQPLQIWTNQEQIISAYYQLSADELTKKTIENKQGIISNSGALIVKTGKFTGRSPKDRYLVKDQMTSERVWWGNINIPFSPQNFDFLFKKMMASLTNKNLYARDVFAGADKRYRIGIRIFNETPWANLFVRNMFIQPNEKELKNFQHDWLVLNIPSFQADPKIDHTRRSNFTIVNFSKKVILIGGSGYTGEIKKSIFSVLNFTLPTNENVLPMHCSANVDNDGTTALFFGLSGTGKTTLSADAKRQLIGDDEHGWTPDNKIFNFEGGCYAKVIDLSRQKEPDIFDAIKKGALLENVIIDKDGHVDYSDTTLTQNTRVSYPLHHIRNTAIPSIGEQTKHIFFLTADAFGVLPPITMLNPYQAAYHFISGYTAKIGGTEEGIQKPQPSFSACFGAPFMPLHPGTYASLLAKKIEENEISVWLINTGWTGGPYGVGHRILLQHTRAMIEAARTGLLNPNYSYTDYHIHSVFGIAQPRTCPGVPDSILSPRQAWKDDEAFYKQAYKLARAFHSNFKQFEDKVSKEILSGAPPL